MATALLSVVAVASFLFSNMSMWPHGVMLGGALLIAVLWLFLQFRAHQQRAAAFDARNAPTFNDWYDHYYLNTPNAPDRVFVEKTLKAFGVAFGIVPTRFLPSDRIESELRLKGALSLDDAWETVDALLAGEFHRSFSWNGEWRTLDDVLRGLADQCDSRAISQ